MPDNKNQHFIPQFYLRRFSQDGSSIHVHHLASERIIPRSSIKGQCSKAYLYGKDPDMEKAIQRIEGAGAEVMKTVTQRLRPPALQSKEAISLLTYIAFQYGRTPTAGEELNALLTEMVRRIVSVPGLAPNAAMDAEIADLKASYKDPIQNSLKLSLESGPCLFDLHSKLVINESPVEFVTSDVAVAFHNQWCENTRNVGTRGLASGGLQIVFPLSPRHLLIFFDASVYKVGAAKSDVVRFSQSSDAVSFNAVQREAAHHNLYFSGDHATELSLRAMTGSRAPRHLQVASQRAVQDGGKNELIHIYHRGSDVKLRAPWMQIRTDARRVPLDERLTKRRAKAMAMDAVLRGPPERRYAPVTAGPRRFTVEPDG